MHVSNGTFICDNCKKVIEQWSVVQIVKRQYFPGDNFENCSSDIKARVTKMLDLCPRCAEEMFSLYSKEND